MVELGGKIARIDRIEMLNLPDAQTQVSALIRDGEYNLSSASPPTSCRCSTPIQILTPRS